MYSKDTVANVNLPKVQSPTFKLKKPIPAREKSREIPVKPLLSKKVVKRIQKKHIEVKDDKSHMDLSAQQINTEVAKTDAEKGGQVLENSEVAGGNHGGQSQDFNSKQREIEKGNTLSNSGINISVSQVRMGGTKQELRKSGDAESEMYSEEFDD